MNEFGNHIPHRPLGQRIAELRKLQGLTLSRLAEVCELSEATLSRIENGRSAVSAQHLFTLSQYLKVDIADFFLKRRFLHSLRSLHSLWVAQSSASVTLEGTSAFAPDFALLCSLRSLRNVS